MLGGVGCQVNHQKNTRIISNERLDTLQADIKIIAEPTFFETAFTKSTKIENKSTFILYGINIGRIKLVSGKIVACDPTLMEEYGLPFTQIFPVGEFPVQLSIAKLDKEETIAFARIVFSDKPVLKWEYAFIKDQSLIPITDKDHKGYVVDAGVGSFMDAETVKKIDRSKSTHLGNELYTEMDKHYHFDWRYVVRKYADHDIAVFSTGLGDGNYTTYIGFDADGQPCRLLTDFGIFNWRKK